MMRQYQFVPFIFERMSVRPVMSSLNYPPFRRAHWTHTYHPHLHHHLHARQFQPSQFRTMATMHGTPTPSLSGITSLTNHPEPSFFEDSYPHERSSFHGDLSHLWPEPQNVNLYNFRPTNLHETNFGNLAALDATDTADTFAAVPRKFEGSSLPALPYKVDTSKYENLDYEDYMMTPTDFEASSPASADTFSTGPRTPTSPVANGTAFRNFYDDAFLVPSNDNFVAKIESDPFGSLNGATFNGQVPNPLHTQFHLPHSMVYDAGPTAANPHAFAHHTHTHGGLVTHMPSFQDYITPTFQTPSIPSAAGSFDMSATSSLPDLERSLLDGTSEVDSDSESEQSTDTTREATVQVVDEPVDEVANLNDRDRYLLDMRAQGISYKEIKRRGRFHEAESTLRGRVRVMTKHKSERVRKPKWTKNDLRLLEQALDIFADGTSTSGRTPWKKISNWMRENGSSYHFAGATCAKKWKSMDDDDD